MSLTLVMSFNLVIIRERSEMILDHHVSIGEISLPNILLAYFAQHFTI